MGVLQLGDGAVGPGAMTPKQIAARKYLGDPNRADELDKMIPEDMTYSETKLLDGQRRLDDRTSGLLTDRITRADRPQTDRLAESLAGVDEGQKSLEVGGLLGGDSHLAMATPEDFNKALSGISKKRFQTTYNDLKREKAFQSELSQSDERQSVAKALARNEQLKLKNYAEQVNFVNQRKILNNQIQDAKDASRSNVLSGILGGLGTIAGALIPGAGVAGAIAGGAIGSGAGKAL